MKTPLASPLVPVGIHAELNVPIAVCADVNVHETLVNLARLLGRQAAAEFALAANLNSPSNKKELAA